MVTTWTYCRNCVAWRNAEVWRTVVLPDGTSKELVRGTCRRRCDSYMQCGPDDGCCEGVPKVGNAGGGK